jgi:hypothetical protein
MPYPLSFKTSEKWKICLAGIVLPYSLTNIEHDYILFQDNIFKEKVDISDGFYASIPELQSAIERSITDNKIPCRFHIPRLNKKQDSIVFFVEKGQIITLSPNLAQLIGIDEELQNDFLFAHQSSRFKSKNKSVNFPGDTQVYVYVNMIQERILRDSVTSLLTVVTLNQKHRGGSISSEPLPREYLTVKPGVYSKIEIKFEESYPNNTTSFFTIPLPEPLTLNDWKVGLLEIQIPITFYNVDDTLNENCVTFEYSGKSSELHISPGLYDSGSQIIDELNRLLKENNLRFKHFEYDENSHKAKVYVRKHSKIVLSSRLAKILSLPEKMEYSQNARGRFEAYKSNKQVDPWIDFYNFFIYTNAVKDRIVNSSLKPLLQVVPITNRCFGNLMLKDFYPPDFINVNSDHYSTISIKIVNDIQDLIRFRAGSVVLKLCFKYGEK